MFEKIIANKRLVAYVVAAIISIILVVIVFASGGEDNKQEVKSTTTTTTLPPKDAQACEYLTEEALAAGGIVPDVEPKRSNDLKRCTFEDIGGSVNYITLYVDVRERCQIWLDDAQESEPLKTVAPLAVYVEELDPTIIVPLGDRCFFLQGSKTIINKSSLTDIAVYIADLFTAIDATTTTTTTTTIVLPEDTTVIPGVNRATTVPTTQATNNN